MRLLEGWVNKGGGSVLLLVARIRGVELWNQLEMVVDNPRQDGLEGDVEGDAARLAEQAQHEEEKALLVGGKHGDQEVGNFEADRRDDHDRTIGSDQRARRARRPHFSKTLLRVAEGSV